MSGAYSGVSARILEENLRAIYIHCHAHQLNLALVDTCKKLLAASDFFSLLESLYVFMSSSVPHSLFIKKQKELGFTREIRLVKLSDTRWSCRHTSIKAIKSTISAVLLTLEEISEGNGSRAVDSRGLLFQVKTFQFFLSLILYDKTFSITGKLSNVLQAEQLNYGGASSCIRATKGSIESLRSESERVKIWEETVELAKKYDIAVSPFRPRRNQRIPQHLNDSLVEETTGAQCSLSEYRSLVYYSTIDTLVKEINQRFSELNLTLLQALQASLPTSDEFLDVNTLRAFLQHYEVDETEARAEASIAMNFLREKTGTNSFVFLHDVYQHLYEVKECFPKLLECLQIDMTMGLTTASAERSFSSLRRLKT